MTAAFPTDPPEPSEAARRDPETDPETVAAPEPEAVAAPVAGTSGGDDHAAVDGDGSTAQPAKPSRLQPWRDRADRVVTIGTDRFDEIEQRVPQVGMARMFLTRYREVNGVVLAGHLAFRTFTFIIPLLFVLVTVAGAIHLMGGSPESVGDNLALGSAVSQSMRTAGDEASRSFFQVATVALGGLLLGAMGLLSGLHYVFARAWQMEVAKIDGKVNKLLRFTGGVVLLVVIALLMSAVRRHGILLGMIGVVGVAAAFFVAFLGLSLIMPSRSKAWYWLVPGAAVATGGLIGLQAFMTFYLPDRIEKLSATYGALGVAIAFLTYLYLLGQIVVCSALASAVWHDYKTGETPTEAGRLDDSPPPFE